MKKMILALPKGRILSELTEILKKAEIIPENDFFREESRKLMFNTNLKFLDIIRVRSFDVATFVAFGAAQLGVAGDDVLKEFSYNEVNNVLDLGIGKCKLSVAHKTESINKKQRNGHLMIATKYKKTVTDFYAKKGIRAECIKLNGAIELAPKLGICSTIVDLVSSGKTLKENNLVESEVLFHITSKLIVNKIAFKLNNDKVTSIIEKFKKALDGKVN